MLIDDCQTGNGYTSLSATACFALLASSVRNPTTSDLVGLCRFDALYDQFLCPTVFVMADWSVVEVVRRPVNLLKA